MIITLISINCEVTSQCIFLYCTKDKLVFNVDIYFDLFIAVYFEQKNYIKCIEQCEQAVEVGRENRADFKLIAKAFCRIGNAYKKLEVWNFYLYQYFFFEK